MKQKIESCYGKEEASKFKASHNWFQRFKRRHNISLRRRTNKKKNAANDGRETIQQFHRDLRKAVQSKRRRSERPVVDNTYGRWWSPKNRLNVDQVPLPSINIRPMKLQGAIKFGFRCQDLAWTRGKQHSSFASGQKDSKQ